MLKLTMIPNDATPRQSEKWREVMVVDEVTAFNSVLFNILVCVLKHRSIEGLLHAGLYTVAVDTKNGYLFGKLRDKVNIPL